MLKIDAMVSLQIIYHIGQTFHHGSSHRLVAAFQVSFSIFVGDRQLSHQDDEFFLNGEDDLEDDFFTGRGAYQPKRGVEFIDRPVGFDPCIRFRHPDPVHQCRFARISGLGRDGHQVSTKGLRPEGARKLSPGFTLGLLPLIEWALKGPGRYGEDWLQIGIVSISLSGAPSGLRTFVCLTQGKPWAMFPWPFGPLDGTKSTRPFFHLAHGDWLGFNRHRLPDRFTRFQRTNAAMPHEPGTGRDQMAHDHIFLKAAQEIDLTKCRCLC
jgi:hypothetical protein